MPLFSNRLRFLEVTPSSVWLSIFGGIPVAYVFVHLLPELAEGQETIAEAVGEGEGLTLLESTSGLWRAAPLGASEANLGR